MTTTRTGLPPDLIFAPDGHVTELCLGCVADGELALVPLAALDHLDGCARCGERLGQAALLSLDVGDALRAASRRAPVPVVEATPVPVSPRRAARARRPLPLAAIAVAVVIAVVTAGPALVDAVDGVPSLVVGVLSWLPTVARIGAAFLRGAPAAVGPWALGLEVASAAMFVVAGLSVARAMSRARSVEGGV
jgi:hypothetical protein